MNVFGQGQNIQALHGNSKFIQFDFPNINLYTRSKIEPIYQLLDTFEQNNGVLRLKMFHLFDEKTKAYSHISYLCVRGIWTKQNLSDPINASENLMDLI